MGSHPNADMIRNCVKVMEELEDYYEDKQKFCDLYNAELDEDGYNADLDQAWYHFEIYEDWGLDVKSIIFTQGKICDGTGRHWWELYNDLCDKETGEIILIKK